MTSKADREVIGFFAYLLVSSVSFGVWQASFAAAIWFAITTILVVLVASDLKN